MTDLEMLEFAARAVKLPEWGWMGDTVTYVKNNTFTEWNPLEDDGEAFRLAVVLGIIVHKGFAYTPTGQVFDYRNRTGPLVATRLAIVRAAAEIGKSVK